MYIKQRKLKRTTTATTQATTTSQATDEAAASATDEATTQSTVQATIQATTHSSAQATNEAAAQPTTLETPIAVSSLNATHEPPAQDEVVSKKRKLTAQFKPPAQIKPKSINPTPINPKPVNPTSINPKPVNPTPINPTSINPKPVNPTHINPTPINPKPVNPKPAVIIKPSTHINTNVKNVYKTPAHVKTPCGSIVITPSAHVTTSVRPSESAKTVVKPSAHVNTFFKTYGLTNVIVNPSAHVDSVVKPWPHVRPFELKKPKLEYPKLDLSKVRRSSRNIFKTNSNGPGKDKDCPIEILDEDDVGDGVLTQEQIDDGDDGPAKVGPCLKTLREIEAGEYMM
jgi:hypothetical protein